ncbi:MAG: sugar phosphate isomerase/epimerase [Candidatus Hydrogenedentes bacterium]|nr:sugar phosphate isomerase/epimerase [Candidatus Hydrogenedentota bacterium]
MYISIRDDMLVQAGFTNLAEGAKQIGVSAVEIELVQDFTVYSLDSTQRVSLQTDDGVASYRKHLDGLGIKACAFLTARDFSMGDLESNTRWVARALEIAEQMDMASIRIDSAMKRERELDFPTRVNLFATGLGGALKRTNGMKVAMGIENHGFQGNNLAFLLNIFRLVRSDRLGSTMDTGNFYWRGYPLSEVYGILQLLSPYTTHTHLKNIRYPEDQREIIREAGWEYGTYVCPLYDGDIDHGRVLQILADAGYTGNICIENESLGKCANLEERQSVLKREVEHLQEKLANLG